MQQTHSRFGANLFAQFVLMLLVSFLYGSLRGGPLTEILAVVRSLLSLSFSVGLLYSLPRWLGVRCDPIEWYYQSFPLGLVNGNRISSSPGVSEVDVTHDPGSNVEELEDRSSEEGSLHDHQNPLGEMQSAGFDFGRLLSPEYIRYAGLLLIISAAFSLLFRIEWSLPYKVTASLGGALLSVGMAEFLYRRERGTLSAIFFLIGFALCQFGVTLAKGLLESSLLPVSNTGANFLNSWLAIKLVITAIAGAWLVRYQSAFVSLSWLTIAYLSPWSMAMQGSPVTASATILFTLVMSVMTIGLAHRLSDQKLAFAQFLLGNVLIFGTLGRWFRLVLVSRTGAPIELFDYQLSPEFQAFLGFLSLFVMHLVSGGIFELLRQKNGGRDFPNFMRIDLVFTHVIPALFLPVAQQQISVISPYYGVTFIGISSISFIWLLIIRSKGVVSGYSDTLLNLALIVAVFGMFVTTQGPWSALVFLAFSCILIYVSFVLGTNRTRGYAFIALTVSVIRLYTKSQELFESVPATFFILIIGGVLLLLSYKLDAIKRMVSEKMGAPEA